MVKSANSKGVQSGKSKIVFLMGALVGALVFVAIYGISILNPTYDDWLLGSKQLEGLVDLSQHYQGWLFYRQSSWHFPLGLIDGLYLQPISVAYTDSIPLCAFIFKLLSPILPTTFQYFGLFGLVCYALMGGYGARLASRFSDSTVYCLMAGLLFVISPVLLKRMFYHTALSAHFLIIIAIDNYVMADRLTQTKLSKKWLILNILALSINPYFVPMTFGIMLLSYLQQIIKYWKGLSCKKNLLLEPLKAVAKTLIGLGVLAWIEGLFYGRVTASAEGLDRLSFNLNQLFNPANYLVDIHDYKYEWKTVNYSSLLPTLSNTSQWQEEGFAYLGLGGIALLFCALLLLLYKACRNIVCKVRPYQNSSIEIKSKAKMACGLSYCVTIILGMLVFTLLAMSPKGTIGNIVLYSIDYPSIVVKALSIFRSTGRLIWPVYYAIMSLGIFSLSRIEKKYAASILMILICVIQLIDIAPALSYKHSAYSKEINYQSNLEGSEWDQLAKEVDTIWFYSPIHYGLYCDPEMSTTFEDYAYKNNLSLNVTYFSRDLSEDADESTADRFKQLKEGKKLGSTLYVFFDCSDLPDADEYGLEYKQIDGYTVALVK